jgi:hypothetical protein
MVGRRRTAPSTRGNTVAYLLLGLATVAVSAGVAWKFVASKATPPTPGPLPTAIPMATPAAPEPPGIDPAQIEQAVSEAPFLAPETARALLEDASKRGAPLGHALDAALFAAGAGFQRMDQAALEVAGRLMKQLWSSRSPSDGRRMQAYLQYARAGDPLSPDEVEAGRALFAEGFGSLPPASRERLEKLFERAIADGIRSRQEAAERTRFAALNPMPVVATPTPPSSRPTPTPPSARTGASRRPTGSSSMTTREPSRSSPSRGQGESYWRSRAARARAAVERAKKRIEELEYKARGLGRFSNTGPTLAACQEGATWRPGMGAIELREEAKKGNRTCNAQVEAQNEAGKVHAQLEAARENLKRAEKALDDLAEEARRDGALPGWLR